MHFASLEYAILISAAFALYWLLYRFRLLRLVVLLVASYTFYSFWNPYYLVLIVASSLFDYFIGARIHRAEGPARRGWLVVGLVGGLGLLGAFKYFNFFSDSAAQLLGLLHLPVAAPHLDVLLPVGISFYTFQSLSYTIDVYRREIEPAPDALSYLVFVAFFPSSSPGQSCAPRTSCRSSWPGRPSARTRAGAVSTSSPSAC